jgi:hypothetical protein
VRRCLLDFQNPSLALISVSIKSNLEDAVTEDCTVRDGIRQDTNFDFDISSESSKIRRSASWFPDFTDAIESRLERH